jgi:hypothetical protein
METFFETQYIAKFAFIETLSAESIAMTGHGIYVYLTPIDIEQLFGHYQDLGIPTKDFARQCVKNALKQ